MLCNSLESTAPFKLLTLHISEQKRVNLEFFLKGAEFVGRDEGWQVRTVVEEENCDVRLFGKGLHLGRTNSGCTSSQIVGELEDSEEMPVLLHQVALVEAAEGLGVGRSREKLVVEQNGAN